MKPTQSVRMMVVILLVVANGLVVGLSAHSLYRSRVQYEQRAETQTRSITSALEQSVSKSIEIIDLILYAVVDELEGQLARDGLNEPVANLFMTRQAQRVPEIESLRVADAEGMIVLGNLVSKDERISVLDREYFSYFSGRDDRLMFISEPLWGRINKHEVLVFARRMNHPDGRFAGVIYATIALEYFTRLLAQFDVGSRGTVALRDAKLNLIARFPPIADQPAGLVGNNRVSDEFRQRFEAGSASATFHTPLGADGVERTVTFRRLERAGMHAIVGVASEDYLADWFAELRVTAALAGSFMLLSLGLGGWLLRLLRQVDAREETIYELAFYDSLTCLPNRRLLIDRLAIAQSSSARSGAFGAILFLDLDQFKSLNDARGHDAGDLMLCEVARRLQSCVRTEDTVSRLAGDEFVIRLENLSPERAEAEAQATAVGEKIRDALAQPYALSDFTHHGSSSIGITLFRGSDPDMAELLRQADRAMYQAKSSGRNAIENFRG